MRSDICLPGTWPREDEVGLIAMFKFASPRSKPPTCQQRRLCRRASEPGCSTGPGELRESVAESSRVVVDVDPNVEVGVFISRRDHDHGPAGGGGRGA